ncbi:hypothetical protein SAMN02746066_03187 [Anaerosporobacter mobilis DSM 15930]|jgi:glycosyltransferase involved in cell wall biosynthesis|uniref:Uncharacterized protein n=1 Tax=Anaerosporobacter mobilis DSM 15930 TaxID=1120996 RepID=A0A1M7LEQ1_9FIRM|nr:glycosyltransferase [Anaerosporobacter mobilis]SHM75891.1 hypothetical protein SAMN02746066_03187 [Anaerosporobacter mobilis DSM 15930]
MRLIKKGIMCFKSEGFKTGMKKIVIKIYREIKKLPYRFDEKINGNKKIDKLQMLMQNKEVYIIIPNIDWNIPLYQRPHQIATELSKRENTVVLFLSDQYRYDRYSTYVQIKDNLWLYSIRMIDKLDKLTKLAKSKIVFMSWTRHIGLLNQFKYDKLVYEYIDDLKLFYYYNKEMEKNHLRLMQTADLTVCTAVKLFNNAKKKVNNVLLCENAGDYEFFSNNRNCRVDTVLKEKVKKYDCVIGYYGCLAYWFDYEMVCKVAEAKKNWIFVLIGYQFDNSADKLVQAKYDNILLLPAQPYEKLPGYIAAFDIQTIPFVINDVTKSTSPVKVFEYMASGLPIITSKMPECLRYKSVKTYETYEEFITLVENLNNLDRNDQYFKDMEEEALENTWKSRVDKILENL